MDYQSLVRAPKFMKFYHLMCKMTGLNLVLAPPLNNGRALLEYKLDSGHLCSYMRNNYRFYQKCCECDLRNSREAVRDRKGRYYFCHAGLYDIAVPVFIGSNHVATFMGGQILSEPPDEENYFEFQERVREYGFDFDRLRELYFKTPSISKDQLEPIFELIQMFSEHFYELGTRLFDNKTGNADFDMIKEYIACNFSSNPSLDEVAEKAGLSPNYFCKWFRDNSGTGYVEYKHRLCLEKAARLLSDSDQDISGIAFESGFTSISSFNRIFRQHYACSPRQYREKASDSQT